MASKADIFKRIKFIVALVMIIGGIYLTYRTGLANYLGDSSNVNEVQAYFISLGIKGYLVYIGICFISGAIALPIPVLLMLGGIAFGPFIGGLLALIGTVAAGISGFFVGKYMLKETVSDMFGSRVSKGLLDGFNEEGLRFLAIARLVPIIPFNAQNFILGLTDVDLVSYSIITFIARIPVTFMYTSVAGGVLTSEITIEVMATIILGGVILLVGVITQFSTIKKMVKST